MDRTPSLKIVAVLGLLQGGFALLRAYNWVQIGSNLFGQGLLLLPVVGVMAYMRGVFVSIVALLYILFGIAGLLGKSWGWWPGLTAAVINLLLVFSAIVAGESLIQAVVWSVVPVILIVAFFSHKEHPALSHA
jgi:hypothetical protein